MIQKTQKNSFGAKLSPKSKTLIKKASISQQTRSAIKSLEEDDKTKNVVIDIVTKKIFGREFFSFVIHPNKKSTEKLKPRHPYFIQDPKNPMEQKILPKRNYYWQNIDAMFQNDILSPQKLKKILNTWNIGRQALNKWAKAQANDSNRYRYGAVTAQKIDQLGALTTVRKQPTLD